MKRENELVDDFTVEAEQMKVYDEESNEFENRHMAAVKRAQEIDFVDNVLIQTVPTQMSFSTLMMGLEKGDYIIPDFQRMYRWSEKQVEELVVSLLRGMPIPPIYGYYNQESQFVILDGQQRIVSLYLYYIGKYLKRKKNAYIDLKDIPLGKESFRERLEKYGLVDKIYYMEYQGSDGVKKREDVTYECLSSRMRRKIDFSTITLIEINVDSKENRDKVLHKIFANLNTGGTPLSDQELRNGVYGCKFYDMLYWINDHSLKWRLLYSGNQNADVNKESKDVELLLRMCAFKYFVKGNGEELTLTGYKGKISLLLDEFSEKVKKFSVSELQEYKESLLSFFDSIEATSGRQKDLALVSLFVIWDRMENRPFITKQIYEEIISSEAYRDTIAQGTSVKSKIEKRFRSVYEKLSGYDS